MTEVRQHAVDFVIAEVLLTGKPHITENNKTPYECAFQAFFPDIDLNSIRECEVKAACEKLIEMGYSVKYSHSDVEAKKAEGALQPDYWRVTISGDAWKDNHNDMYGFDKYTNDLKGEDH